MVEDWLTTAEAVALSGYNLGHLRRLLREGKIEGRKFGTIWQVSRKSLLIYTQKALKSADKRRGSKN